MPTEWIKHDRIRAFTWKIDKSAGTAALMLFFVFCHFASERLSRSPGRLRPVAPAANPYDAHLGDAPDPNRGFIAGAMAMMGAEDAPEPEPVVVEMVSHLTYDDLGALTGLSRESISAGLKLLIARKMIRHCGSARTGDYHLEGLEDTKRWAKLPGQALLSPAKTAFMPLTRFELRSRHELNALKMHFYYASVRSRENANAECTFETINAHTGVAERDIPRANSLLLTTGLLSRYGRTQTQQEGSEDIVYGTNKYYMEGYESLFVKSRTLPAGTPT